MSLCPRCWGRESHAPGCLGPTTYEVAALKARVSELERVLGGLLKSFENYMLERKPPAEWDEYDAMMAPYWTAARALEKKP